ncbi:hypothetical protein ACLBOM_06770 [Escherichia coli]
MRAFNNAILTERHLFTLGEFWQHGYDDVALFSDRFSRRRCFCTEIMSAIASGLRSATTGSE